MTRTHHCGRIIAVLALALALTVPAFAGTAGRVGRDIPLAELTAQAGPMRLSGASAQLSLSLPVSARETVRAATLHVQATNSIALQAQRSELLVLLNEHVLAQVPLSPSQPEISADIRLPVDRFQPGYNRLTFAVAQHVSNQCEDPAAPEMWTEIDGSKSTVRIDTELKPLAPTLADLGTLFDPAQWSARQLVIVTPGSGRVDLAVVNLGGRLAEGAALRLAYVPLPVRHAFAHPARNGGGVLPGLDMAPLAGADLILAGTREQLRPFVDPALAARIDGGFLAVYPLDRDARHFVILVSGRTPAEVDAASRVFATLSLPFPRQREMKLAAGQPVPGGARLVSAGLQADSRHRFDELGLHSREMSGESPADIDLPVDLPPDLYAPETAKLVLDLNYAAGARMRDDSVLNILVNGRLQQAIPLDDPHGGMIEHYLVQIPLHNFLPGHNVVTFAARLHAMSYGTCQNGQTGNLRLTLFGDSSVIVPPASHFTRLPDLALLGRTGFPYADRAGGGVNIVLGARDSATVGAAWSLLGKLAQQGQQPVWNVRFGEGGGSAGQDLLFVGVGSTLPASLRVGAPWFYTAGAASDARLNGQAVLMQYRSPLDGGHSLTVLAAATPDGVWQGSASLIDPAQWGQLAGDVDLLDLGEPRLSARRLGADYTVGDISRLGEIGYQFSQRPWLFVASTLAAVAALSVLTLKLLRRFRRRRQRQGEA
jgi:hypothetical protein